MLALVMLAVGVSAEADPAILSHHGHHAPYTAAHHVPYCGNGGVCVPPVFCSAYYLEALYDPAAPCYLAHGTPGVCCAPKKHSCK